MVINDLIGLKPREDNILEINPLITAQQWDWFCLDDIRYHGKTVTILWDKDGTKYKKGQGLFVFVNGKKIASSKKIEKLTANLPL